MTPNKLPPLPEPIGETYLWDGCEAGSPRYQPRTEVRWKNGTPAPSNKLFTADQTRDYAVAYAEALRQSQSLPAGAVAGLVGKWRNRSGDTRNEYKSGLSFAYDVCADELEAALRSEAGEVADEVEYAMKMLANYATLTGGGLTPEKCGRFVKTIRSALQADAREKGEAQQFERDEEMAAQGWTENRDATQPAQASPLDQLAAQAQELNMGYETQPAQASEKDEVSRLREALESIRQYGADTLSGRMPSDGPDNRQWQRDAVKEMTKRAREALATSGQETASE